MKKWLASLATVGGFALTVYTPDIQAAISSHPNVALGLMAAWSVLNHIMPSPTQPTTTGKTGGIGIGG